MTTTPAPRPPSDVEFAVVTHYITASGQVIMHAYGGYPTRSAADSARKRMWKRAEGEYSAAELARATMKTSKILRDV